MTTCLVTGAAGYTGRFVVTDLRRRGYDVLAADRATLALPDPERLAGLLAGVDVVVHCAGPFADHALEVARVCIAAGVHYVDVCAEQAVTRDLLALAPTRSAVVPSAAFFGGLGSLVAAAAAGDWERADVVDLVYALSSWHPTSGTRRTGERNAGRHLTLRDGRLQPHGEPEHRTAPDGEPLHELFTADQVTLPRRLAAPDVRAWMSERALADLADPTTPPPAPGVGSADGRSDQRFEVTATVTRGDERRTASAGGRDIYAASAPLAGAAVDAVVSGEVVGVRTLVELLDPADYAVPAVSLRS